MAERNRRSLSPEVCGNLPAGLKVGWNFEASELLDFNVHHHIGKEVVFPSKFTAVVTAKDTLATKIDQDYCRNRCVAAAAGMTDHQRGRASSSPSIPSSGSASKP